MTREVADNRLDHQIRVALVEHVGGVQQRRLADVERHEPFDLAVGDEGVEQAASLVAGAGSQLDHGGRAGHLGDHRRARCQDLAFGLGRVVLVEAGDLVEQLAASIVVEPSGRERAGP